jgi:ribulose-5-phosphate 4-epimerase/fuculose-1-phosphate aldolase
MAAAHSHSVYGKAYSALRRPLEPITQDACAFFEDHAVFDSYAGVVLDADEGKRIAHALASHKAAILANHGLLTVGRSVDEAVWWFVAMERSCQAQLLAIAAGPYESVDAETARLTRSQIGTPGVGWFSFQPLYDWIVAQQPDLLEE